MKNISESLKGIQDITPYLNGERVDEGLKDIFKTVKAKFKAAFIYLKGIVVKFGNHFLPVDENGEILPANTPLTAGYAYIKGLIKGNNTFVHLDGESAKICGCKNSLDDVFKLYGKDDPIAYWRGEFTHMKPVKDSIEDAPEADVNEVQLQTIDPQAKYNIVRDDSALADDFMRVIQNKGLARLMVWGAPGIGKTSILKRLVKTLKKTNPNFKLIVKTLSNETPDGFFLPAYYDVEGERRATDVPKSWLPVYRPTGDDEEDAILSKSCGEGVLFIDELSRATNQVLNVMLPLIQDGELGEYKLGDGWRIICASNRMEDDANSQARISNALGNRYLQVHYEPTIDSWREWAEKQRYISPLLLQWLSLPENESMSGGKYYYWDPNHKGDSYEETTLMCTPRSWTHAMQYLSTFVLTANDRANGEEWGDLSGFKICSLPEDVIKKALNMGVPGVAADAFVEFLRVIEQIGDFDRAVYEVWQNGGKGFKLDKKNLNKITLPIAQLICTAHAHTFPTQKEWENLCDWMISQKSDQLASYVLDVFKNTFLAKLPESSRNYFFWMAQFQKDTFAAAGQGEEKRGRGRPKKTDGTVSLSPQVQQDLADIKSGETLYRGLCDAFGLDYYNLPDYGPGLDKLIDEFGESFNTATVGNHKSALG